MALEFTPLSFISQGQKCCQKNMNLQFGGEGRWGGAVGGGWGLHETMLTTSQVELDELKSLEFFLFFSFFLFLLAWQTCLVFMFGEEKGAMANLLSTSQVEQHALEHYRH